jgi:phage baseplate assembly protein W
MAKKQYFGISYPFTSDGFQNFYLDVNESVKDKVRSQLMHIVFTPKGQRIRNPEFGTDLIKFIFEPNDQTTWESVKNEVSESVKRWASNIAINDIQIVKNEQDESEIYVRLDYSVSEGNKVTNDSVVIQV